MNLNTCSHYLDDKQHKVAFQRSSLYRRSYFLDLIQIDVCSMIDKFIGGALYFFGFINDYSRKF
jgi:hypothetical protein